MYDYESNPEAKGVEYQITEVDPTSTSTKGKVYQVYKVTEEIAATMAGKIYRARIIKDPTESTVIGKVYQVVFVDDPDDPSVKGKVYNAIVTGLGQVVVIGPAVSPLVLPDAIDGNIVSLKAFGGLEQRNIPQPYTQVNYVTNTTATAVSTDVMTDITKKYELEVRCRAVTGSWYILQSRASGGSITGISGSSTGNTIIAQWAGVGVSSGISRTLGNTLYVKATFDNGNITLYVKDETAGTEDTATGTYSTSAANPSTPVYLWGNAKGDRVDINSDVYMVRIKENGVTLVDWIPCRQSTTVGFYDTITDTFITATTPSDVTADGDAVPTPDTPMDIVCNNGVLKWDSVNQKVYTDGTVETIGIKDSNNLLPVDAQPDVLYPVTVTGAGNWTASANVNNGQNLAACEIRYYNENKQQINYYTINGYSDGRMYKVFSVTTAVKYVSITRKAAYATTPVTELKVETGNTMTPYFNGGIATAEMLLKVGNYQDQQEIISGAVTRKVGVKMLDGTENVGTSNATFTISISDRAPSKTPLICSHFQYSNKTSSQTEDLTVISFSSTNIGFRYDACANAAAFKTWLTDQYVAGTPVIVVYLLATETTETVTGQPMQTMQGDNIVEITQASMDGLELEVTYNAGVQLTVEEVEDAQLSPDVEVTIQ